MTVATSFPAPVGGVSLRQHDLAPSILFAVGYGILIPVMIFRVIDRRSRTTVFIGTNSFVIERVVLFCLRSVVAAQEGVESDGLTEYMQVTIGMGFVAIAQDVVNLLRSLLVNSTYEHPPHVTPTPDLVSSLDDTGWPLEVPLSTVPSFSEPSRRPDQPRHRFWWRRFIDVTTILFLVSLITGFVGNSMLVIQRDNKEKNYTNQVLRYVSCAVVVVITIVCGLVTVYARFKIPRADRKGASFVIFLTTLLTIVGIFRLIVMANYTPSMGYIGPGSQNTPSAKIAFYICHVLPEWISATTLFGFNMREIFQTGLSGDNRWRDEHPDEVEDRLRKEEEKRTRRNQMIKVTVSSRFDEVKTPTS